VEAHQILDQWDEVADRVAQQRDDLQAATLNGVVNRLRNDADLSESQEKNLVSYIDVLPRDLRFGMVKTLLQIPAVAKILSRDEHDAVVLDVIEQISREAS
jgi:tellurite resistance protein